MLNRDFVRSAAVVSAAFLATLSATGLQARPDASPLGGLVAQDRGQVAPGTAATITVHLKGAKDKALEEAVDALYDPQSPTYHAWMTDAELRRYAPPQAQLDAVRRELESHGLRVVSVDPNGFSLRATGTTGNLESAFQTTLHQIERKGILSRSNVTEARLTGAAGAYVAGVSGLAAHTVRPMFKQASNLRTGKPYSPIAVSKVLTPAGLAALITDQCVTSPATKTLQQAGTVTPVGVFHGAVYDLDVNKACDFTAKQLQHVYGLDVAYQQGLNGAGQTIVLVEGYGYPNMLADANAFSTLMGLPALTSSSFQVVYPEGQPNPRAGELTGWSTEIALDIDWAHAMAPGAKIVVVATNGQDNEDFQYSIAYAANHHLGNSVSNSWEEDVDLIAGPLEQQSYEQLLLLAAARGISVNFSTGDGGDNGTGDPLGAPGVPSVAPHATAVGGTAILNRLGSSAFDHVGWGDSLTLLQSGGQVFDPPLAFGFLGGGGGGESTYFAKPAWQRSLPGTGRQTPDVSALADPYTGVPIVVTSGGTQNVLVGIGGTSLACPIFSAIWAIANQKAGHALGQAGPLIARATSGITDVLPLASPNNLAGIIFDSNGATYYSSADLFAGSIGSQKNFLSFLYGDDLTNYAFAFGLDTSLTVTQGWDNVTGYGTPIGMAFLDGVAK